MAASASYLAAVDESVLAEHMEALRVYFGRVLGEKRLWEARSGELGLWALAERTFWFLVRVAVVGAVYAWPLAGWMARFGALYVWPLVREVAVVWARCYFWPIAEMFLARLVFGR